jgi:hypothetical protein
MRYFVPRFKIATLAGKQDRLLSKIGGVPWGLPERFWPRCCGQPQKLLAQLCHEPPMLDLGGEGNVLHLFQCLECCGIGDQGRAAFIVDRSFLGSELAKVAGYDHKPELGEPLIGEVWIDGWEERDDGIPGAQLASFYDRETLWAIQQEFPEIEWFDCRENTKFGGSPRWTANGPTHAPATPFEFLLQLNDYLFVSGSPPDPDEVGCSVLTYIEGDRERDATIGPRPGRERINAPWFILHEQDAEEYCFAFTNLGTDGTLYVFIDRTHRPHGVTWFWNR